MKIDRKWTIVTMIADHKVNEVRIYTKKNNNKQAYLTCDRVLVKRYITK